MTYFHTPPLNIIDLPADAQHKGGERRAYRHIVLHSTGGTDSRAWLTRTSPPTNPVSIHRLISKTGAIYKIVADHEVAWHAGVGVVGPLPGGGANLNHVSLGIELENLNDARDPYPVVQVRAAALQTVEWFGLYGLMSVVAHAWVDKRKSDPQGFPWDMYYSMVFNALRGAL